MGSFFPTLVRVILIVINFLVLVFGLLVAGGGIYAYIKFKDAEFAKNTRIDVENFAPAIIVLGCIIIVISFTGFWGAIRKSQCLLITFACFMFLFVAAYGFSLYVVMAGYGKFNYDIIKNQLHTTISTAFSENNIEANIFEDLLYCCGATGPDSYRNQFGPNVVPITCCAPQHNFIESYSKASSYYAQEKNSWKMVCAVDKAHKAGCLDAMTEALDSIWGLMRNTIIGKLVVVSLEFIGAVYLSSAKSSEHKQNRRLHY